MKQVGRVNKSTIIIDGNADIRNSVYGGGNYGFVNYGNTATEDDGGNIEYIEDYINKSNDFVTNEPYLITSSTGNGYRLNANGNTANRVAYDTYDELTKDWILEPSSTIGEYYIKNVATNNYLSITYNYSTVTGQLNGRQQTMPSGLNSVTASLSATPMSFVVQKNNNRLMISKFHQFDVYRRERQGGSWRNPT